MEYFLAYSSCDKNRFDIFLKWNDKSDLTRQYRWNKIRWRRPGHATEEWYFVIVILSWEISCVFSWKERKVKGKSANKGLRNESDEEKFKSSFPVLCYIPWKLMRCLEYKWIILRVAMFTLIKWCLTISDWFWKPLKNQEVLTDKSR